MLDIQTKISGSELSSRKAKLAVRSAEETALLHHRETFLPLHFKPAAKFRYPVEYKKQPGKYSRSSSSTRKRGNVRRQTEKQRKSARKSSDQSSRVKLPLVDSGLTRLKMLSGGVKILGASVRRRIQYNPPFYIFTSAAGQINKARALNALNSQEEIAMVKIVEKEFYKLMEN